MLIDMILILLIRPRAFAENVRLGNFQQGEVREGELDLIPNPCLSTQVNLSR